MYQVLCFFTALTLQSITISTIGACLRSILDRFQFHYVTTVPRIKYETLGSCATASCGDSSQPWDQAKQLPRAFHHQFALLLVHIGNHCPHIQSAGGSNTMVVIMHAINFFFFFTDSYRFQQ